MLYRNLQGEVSYRERKRRNLFKSKSVKAKAINLGSLHNICLKNYVPLIFESDTKFGAQYTDFHSN
jgi:hypothetical protein